MRKVVAIHQPNFYPWLGFFDKWYRADVFVLLDDVQYPKTGAGGWTNRCRILLDREKVWITASINRSFHGVKAICEIELSKELFWREKLMRKLEHAYSRTAHYSVIKSIVEADLGTGQSHLFQLNLASIKRLGNALGLDQEKIVLSSSLNIEGRATQRLCDIVQEVGGSAYLSGGGAGGYQDEQVFSDAGIDLTYQNFIASEYQQFDANAFVSGLSVLDALCFLGIEGTRNLLEHGRGS
jgi:hypothetical protein